MNAKSETFTHCERIYEVFVLKIYSPNELLKMYSLNPQERMIMEKIITFST